MKKFLILVATTATLSSLLLYGCSNNTSNDNINVKKISSEEAKSIIDSSNDEIIVDVREKNEYEEGHIKDSILIPLDTLENTIEDIIKDKDSQILVYCRSGRRSAEASKIIKSLGYTNIYDFGGIIDWKYEIEK
ncbi:rhodanese-like domain-containing protein [Clostridioides difficile]